MTVSNKTSRYGFTVFDSVDDTLDYRGYKLTNADRVLLDRLLTLAAERHVHTGDNTGGPDETPDAAPTVAVVATGGAMPPNTTVYYRSALVDAAGQEHIASQPAVVYTPASVYTPDPPAVTAGTGSLIAGPYSYAVSAYTGTNTAETTVSRTTPASLATTGGLVVSMPAVPSGASGFNIYRRDPTQQELVYLTSIDADTVAFADTGATTPNTLRRAPAANTTCTTTSVSVTPATALAGGATCKIYRTYSPSNWDQSLLTWTATVPVVDTGHATTEGAPPDASAAVATPTKIGFGTETTGALPPGLLTTTRFFNFAVVGLAAIGPGDQMWLNEYAPPVYWTGNPVYDSHVANAEFVSFRVALTRGAVPSPADIEVGLETGPGPWVPVGVSGTHTTATIPAGETSSPAVSLADVDNRTIATDTGVRFNVLQDGSSGGSGAANDFTVTVTIRTRHGSTTQSYQWETV